MRQSRKKWERKREEQRNKVIALLFIVMMVIFCVVNIATADRGFSAKENRALEQRPKLTISGIESGRWMKQYESYVSDQFAGRDFWVALKSRIDLIAGKRKANGVFKGKDHYLLEDIARPDEEQLKANLDAMKKFQETYKDIPMYMMLVPNAANIESDKLPYCAVTEDQDKQFQKIKASLGTAFQWVNVEDTLKKHRAEEIYYHTDHHWTTLGAYYGYQALAAAMKLDTSKAPAMKSYAVTNSFNGTLSATERGKPQRVGSEAEISGGVRKGCGRQGNQDHHSQRDSGSGWFGCRSQGRSFRCCSGWRNDHRSNHNSCTDQTVNFSDFPKIRQYRKRRLFAVFFCGKS